MSDDAQQPSRPGSAADLSRRMDAIEKSHEALVKDVTNLAGTVARVELNQGHQAELNKLRFDSLDASITGVGATLERFMGRINAIISGEVRLPQNEKIVRDYEQWKSGVDQRLDAQDVLNGQVKLLGRLGILLVTSNIVAIGTAIFAAVNS